MLKHLKRLQLILLPAVALLIAAAPPSGNPRIVLQSRAPGGVEAAAWTPDDKYLITANGTDRELTIWDVAHRRIVDHVGLPVDPTAWSSDFLRVERIELTPDGGTALVHGVVIDFAGGMVMHARDFRVDLAKRTVAATTGTASLGVDSQLAKFRRWVGALTVFYQNSTDITEAAAKVILPVLPRSHDGRYALSREDEGLRITGGGSNFLLTGPEPSGIDDGALSPDGTVLAMIGAREEKEGGTDQYQTVLTRFNVAAGHFMPTLQLDGDYGIVRWLDKDRMLLTSDASSTDRDSPDESDPKLPLSPGLIIDAQSGATLTKIPGRCYIQPLGSGYIGAGVGNCRTGMGASHTLEVANPGWKQLIDFKTIALDAIAISHDGKLVAITADDPQVGNQIVVIDAVTSKVVDTFGWPKGIKSVIGNVWFTSDDHALIIAANGSAQQWRFGTADPVQMFQAKTTSPQMMANDGTTLYLSGGLDAGIARVNLADGKPLPPIPFANAIAGGFLPGRPIFWAASSMSAVRLWDTRDWHVLFTSYLIVGGHYVTVTPEGRYDTDLGPDADAFRWIVPDAPFQSLGAQTFMRDYFTPRLAQKLLDCTAANSCPTALPALPSLASLNRVMPEISIVKIEGGDAGSTIVRVQVKEGVDAAAANGRTHSGVYNIRLFRNGRLIDNEPNERNEVLHQSLPEWREANGWAGGGDANGVWQFPFVVQLPTGPGAEKQVFTAYAFNEDRVKSETARFAYTAPPTTPRPRRAYIVTIGIDAYDDPRLKLNFSAADAKLMGQRLSAIPGYEVHQFDLTSATLPDGRTRRVTIDVIRAAFAHLIGAGSFEPVRDALKDFDTTGIDQVTPDDLVIVTWSGHGWANPQGDFFLVPADAKWPAGADPDQSSLISAADLTMFLRAVPAGEMAFIIDACHSAASVDTAGFKPGPMGDPGLGQLAYDKGMRILAATQSDDVALEDAHLGQGLLTYALADEGLTPTGGRADENKDGRITLDEWLRYAVARLPTLSADVKLGKIATARGFREPGVTAKGQEPALFDFTGTASPVVLKIVAK